MTEQQQLPSDLMFLPQDFWSPRYDSTFYTVKLEGFERLTELPPSSSSAGTVLVPGKTNVPAYYYKVVVYREHKRKTLLRRYSQFKWLYSQLLAHPPVPPAVVSKNNNNQQQQYDDTNPIRLSSSAGCPFQWWQDDAFAAHRLEDLTEFLSATLGRPGYARHPAVVAFLELL
jgi:PX domain